MVERAFRLEEDLAAELEKVSAAQHRSESELVAEALREYLRSQTPSGERRPSARPPETAIKIPGLGEFDSGDPDFARTCDDLLEEAARRGRGF